MTVPIRLAILGVGLIGKRHLATAAREPNCSVIAAADVTESARQSVEIHGARFYTDHRELLSCEQLDGVIVATPNSTHAEIGVDCAAAGLPMLVDKPLADTLESGRTLLAAAEKAGVSIAVGHHRRFDPAVEKAKSILDGGDLGQLTAMHVIWALRKHDSYYETRWRTSRSTGGGPGLINLIHDIDLMRHFGGDIDRVYAELGRGARGLDVEDSIAVTVRFTSGVVGSLLTSDATPSPWGWEQGSGENPNVPESGRNCYRLLGTSGALALPRLKLYRHAAGRPADWRSPIAAECIGNGPRAALRAQLADFCAVVRGDVTPRVNGHDGFASLAATLAIIRSGEIGQVVHPEGVHSQD
jgi:predicted dehydrogenase